MAETTQKERRMLEECRRHFAADKRGQAVVRAEARRRNEAEAARRKPENLEQAEAAFWLEFNLALMRFPFVWKLWKRWQAFRNRRSR